MTGQNQNGNSTKTFERTLNGQPQSIYVLRLYVTGTTPASARAVVNIKKICEKHLLGRYELEVIDIYQQPDQAKREQIVAAPTLIKKLPPPPRRMIGDLSDTERVLTGMDLQKKKYS